MTRLQQAAKIANWKLLQLKGAIRTLEELNKFHPDTHHRLSNAGRLKAMAKELEAAIKASYQEYKENELRARATGPSQAGQGEVTGKERVYKELPF